MAETTRQLGAGGGSQHGGTSAIEMTLVESFTEISPGQRAECPCGEGARNGGHECPGREGLCPSTELSSPPESMKKHPEVSPDLEKIIDVMRGDIRPEGNFH